MPRVTDIQVQKNGRFFSIFIDGRYSFSLGDLELSASNLRTGFELTSQEVEAWQNQSGLSKVQNQALTYLGIRPRSVLEMRQYLKRKDVPEDTINLVVIWLEQKRYLDDVDFAKRWANYRRQEGLRSDARIRAELRQKGIAPDVIEEALGQTEQDQLTTLKQFIQKRRPRYADEQKLINYLARQGYRWSDIQQAIRESD